jgi:hypothetical protein
MTAILFAKDDATNGDTPAPKRGRAANSRTAEAKVEHHHDPNIRAPDRAFKRAVDSAGFARRKLDALTTRQGALAGVWSVPASSPS